MAEPGGRRPASEATAEENLRRIAGEQGQISGADKFISKVLREELLRKGFKGFKRGGKVKKSGVAKVHRGERVLTAKQAKKPAVKTALRKPARTVAKARRR